MNKAVRWSDSIPVDVLISDSEQIVHRTLIFCSAEGISCTLHSKPSLRLLTYLSWVMRGSFAAPLCLAMIIIGALKERSTDSTTRPGCSWTGPTINSQIPFPFYRTQFVIRKPESNQTACLTIYLYDSDNIMRSSTCFVFILQLTEFNTNRIGIVS